MGKKNLRKYKHKKNIDQEEFKEDVQSEEISSLIFKDPKSLLEKLTCQAPDIKNSITSIISTYQFETKNNESLKQIFTSKEILNALVNLIPDNSIQVQYNAISSLSNVIISFSDTDIDEILFNQTNFVEISLKFLKDFENVDKNSQNFIKTTKILKNLINLFMLLLDLTEVENSKKFFKNVLNELFILLLSKTDLLNEDLILLINKFIGNVFSTIIITITNENDDFNNLFKSYIEKQNNIFDNSQSTLILKSLSCYSLFYINLINNDYFKQNNINFLQKLIDFTYNEISNDASLKNLNEFSEIIDKISKDKIVLTEENKKLAETNEDIKAQSKIVENEVYSLLQNLKIFQEIITTIEIPQTSNSNNNINENEFEEIDDDENIVEEKNDAFEEIIYKGLNEILSVNEYEPLKKMLNQKIMENLSNLCDVSNKLSEYYINENDNLIIIKEDLNEIEYISLSIINNIILKYPKFINETYLNSLYSFLGNKIKTLVDDENDDEYFLSIIILTLRTILDKYNGNFKNFKNEDYENLFNIFSKTQDNFIKCNLIDIISMCACVDNNFKVGNELKNILFKEKKVEILAHVINAFMDIFKNDDLESNKFLKEIDIINLMSKGVSEFKNMLKNGKKNKELDSESVEYCKETSLNMKRFIKYKEDSFKQLKLI